MLIFDPKRLKSECIYDSIIIERKQFAIFANWIDKNKNSHYNLRNIPYKFNLLYRASRDSYTPEAFHDNNGATIVLAKISDPDQIVGGYNPLQWGRNGSTVDSFIYSFEDKENIKTARINYSVIYYVMAVAHGLVVSYTNRV